MLGLIAYGLALPGFDIHGIRFDAHTLLFGTLALLCGYQAIFFAIAAKILGIKGGLLPPDPRVERFVSKVPLEVGVILGSCAMLIGTVLLGTAINHWRLVHFGNLNYAQTMRLVVPGATLTALGFQTILSAFLLSLLDLPQR